MQDHLGNFKAWNQAFLPGATLFRNQEPFTVLSSGTDFLILKSLDTGTQVKLSRNTPESYEYTASPREGTPALQASK